MRRLEHYIGGRWTRPAVDTAPFAVAAYTVTRVAQELGGKSPNLVFADADLQAAVKRGVLHCFNNSGQSCNAPTRMLVEDSAYERALAIAEEIGAGVRVGDPTLPDDHLGPVVSKLQFERIQRLIVQGIEEGARVIVGGAGKPEGVDAGYFVRPTIFADVHTQMTVAREEIFGAVLCILRFRTLDEAIEIAVQCGDLETARAVARRLRAGSVYLNGAGQDYESPFGGFKQSGNGREWGKYGLLEYLELKTINGFHSAPS